MTIRVSKEVIRKPPAVTLPEITVLHRPFPAIKFVAEANKIVAYIGKRTIVWHVPLLIEELPETSPTLSKREICHCSKCSPQQSAIPQRVLPSRSLL